MQVARMTRNTQLCLLNAEIPAIQKCYLFQGLLLLLNNAILDLLKIWLVYIFGTYFYHHWLFCFLEMVETVPTRAGWPVVIELSVILYHIFYEVL